MTSYSPIGQFTGTFSSRARLGTKIPWVYIIASLSSRTVYVGESLEDGGLFGDLAVHLGTLGKSAMVEKAQELDLGRPDMPHVVIAARLPSESDPAEFDGTSASVREQCQATLQAKIAERFVAPRGGWIDLTVTGGTPVRAGSAIDNACEAIFGYAINTIDSMAVLSRTVPLHVVVLDPYPIAVDESDTLEGALSEIEVKLHDWVVGKLRASLGANWWGQGIPLKIRTDCASRRELDGGDHSINLEAYMMFIDLAGIADSQWSLMGPLMEAVAGRQGKKSAISWIGELNELRKIVAHPIRGKYVKHPLGSFERVVDLRAKLKAAIARFPV